jgi:predicted GNAT family acetyltransferase
VTVLRILQERSIPQRDLRRVNAVLETDPVATCLVASRIERFGLDHGALGGSLWTAGDPTTSLCFAGGNLMPLYGDAADIGYFAERARRSPRSSSSLVGRRELVLPLWEELRSSWGPPRAIRDRQPLMALDRPPTVPGHPGLHRPGVDRLDDYLAASIAMFTVEVGIDPCGSDGGAGYRRRVQNTILSGNAFAVFDEQGVAFKAEIGAMSARVGQIQGVWVRPDLRGHGLGGSGTAAVAEVILRTGRIASLYVNDFNIPARRAYERIGFRRVADFATVMLI